MSTVRKILGPLNRVEGDLEVRLEVKRERVARAWVNSPLFRGFERILVGKSPADALVYTPRICGICSVAQSVAAATALADLRGISPTANGKLAVSLALACENLSDHLSHFYLFFMPDFAREAYRNEIWYEDIATRFRAQSGSASADVLPARATFLQTMGLLLGKWPHSLSIQPGGSSKPLSRSEQLRVAALLGQFRRFLEQTLFADSLENVAAISSLEQLKQWQLRHSASDFGRFLALADALQLNTLGRAADHFMCYGAYGLPQGCLFRRGTVILRKRHAVYSKLEQEHISEDVSNAWLRPDQPRHPLEGDTQPDAEREAYSWCKAPRLDGQTYEVGALARQVVNGHALAVDLVAAKGGNVFSRVVGRLLEFALLVPEMEQWCAQLVPHEAYCVQGTDPEDGDGIGMVEAARGSLGHWLRVEKGRIRNYQIIAPTTWNFSPRDAGDHPGPLEKALEDTPVSGSVDETLALQHIIRSFDPCMVCTVH